MVFNAAKLSKDNDRQSSYHNEKHSDATFSLHGSAKEIVGGGQSMTLNKNPSNSSFLNLQTHT